MFKEDITRTIGKVLKKNGHRMIYLCKHTILYIKRYSKELAFYIRLVDNRWSNGEGYILVEMYFIPVDWPDDRIMNLSSVGIHMEILKIQGQAVTDEIMVAAGKKAVDVENNIGSLAGIILEELENPQLPYKRVEIYKKLYLSVYNVINEDEALKEEFDSLKRTVCEDIKKRRKSQCYWLCSDLVDKLTIDYFREKGIEQDIRDIKNNLQNHVYAQCVLDV